VSPDKSSRKRRERGGDLAPGPRARNPEHLVYLVCEGDATEYEYFTMINREFGALGFRLDFPPRHVRRNGLTPRQVVSHALSAAEKEVDAIWALFDRDQHMEIPAAFNDARGTPKVHIGFSNPSFDLWLLFHFQPYGPTTGGSSADVHGKLGSCPAFAGFGKRDKHITEARARVLADRVGDAVKNARAQVDTCSTGACSAKHGHASSCSPLDRDPSTDVYLLIESLRLVPLNR